jgi:spore maturation protein CgeB
VLYADSPAAAVAQVRRLLDHPDERDRLVNAARRTIVDGPHAYKDRLSTIVGALS